MNRSDQLGATGRRVLLGAPASFAVLLGIWLIGHGAEMPAPPPQPSAAQAFPAYDSATHPAAPAAAAPAASTPVRVATGAMKPMTPSTPTRVRIPAIQVDAPLTGLALDGNGRLNAPPDNDRNLAGWYQAGTSPGANGTAVLAGHVDTHQGPAVFYNLGALKKGNTVEVDRTNGSTAVFTIDAIEAYTAQQFPNSKVYGKAANPELRLITCGAGFDKARQQYLGNVVVYAHLTGSRTTKPQKR